MDLIDDLTSLAFSIYSGKGIYAFLLGSGVSRAAEIPTGWDITLDLVRQVATLKHETCGPDPEKWYTSKFGKAPDYSLLLGLLAKTSAERTTALARYFEPSQDDRENGRRIPTKAHQQIAKLVANQYIKVIITTNFDRLMEQALEAEGVIPTVISTVDAIKGAMPLQHSACTLIKVHGDYRDTRFRNTEEELVTYPAELDALLDRVIDEYGIVVCGWSATWDHALRAVFVRSPNRRFTTAWASKGQTSATALDLIRFRQAQVIDISSSDDFFSELGNKIAALEKFHAPHPLSIDLAVASTKRFLSKPEFRIALIDLVTSEVERQVGILNEDPFLKTGNSTLIEYGEALTRIEQNLSILLGIITTGIIFGQGQYPELWNKTVTRMADLISVRGDFSPMDIRPYPASLLLYAAGVAGCTVGDYRLLHLLFKNKTSIQLDMNGEKTLLIDQLTAMRAIDGESLKRLTQKQFRVPGSEHIFESLRIKLRSAVPNDTDFEDIFDRFEYLLALGCLEGRTNGNRSPWGPIGRFGYRNRHSNQHVSKILNGEHLREGANWGPIAQGLFDDAGYQLADRTLRELLQRVNW